MSQLAIADLNFFEAVFPDEICISGGSGISASASNTPSISLAYDTAYDTRYATDYNVTGDQLSGFGVSLLSLGSAAGAASAATSIGGVANAKSNARA
jgi:hypothetical protein